MLAIHRCFRALTLFGILVSSFVTYQLKYKLYYSLKLYITQYYSIQNQRVIYHQSNHYFQRVTVFYPFLLTTALFLRKFCRYYFKYLRFYHLLSICLKVYFLEPLFYLNRIKSKQISECFQSQSIIKLGSGEIGTNIDFKLIKPRKKVYKFFLYNQHFAAMKQTELTRNGIPLLMQETQKIRNQVVLQIVSHSIMPAKSRLNVIVTDGAFTMKGFIELKKVPVDLDQIDNSLILVKEHVVLTNVGVSFENFQILGFYKSTIGEPVDYFQNNGEAATGKTFPIDPKFFTPLQKENSNNSSNGVGQMAINKEEIVKNVNISNTKAVPPSSIKHHIQIEPMVTVLESDIKQTETIRQFYSGIDNWEIIARVIKIDYRQFTNKKGKYTKVINIVLIDRSGMKIDGACFGDPATQYRNFLKENQVYKVSKGTVSEDDYARSRNKGNDYSKYKILFNERSVFQPISDVGLIPRSNQTYFEVGEAYQQKIFDSDFDVIGVLLEVNEAITLPKKDGKQITKRSLLVADPKREICVQVIIWNDKPEVDKSMEGKAVILKGFRMKEYRDIVSFNSNFRSSIQPLVNHQWCRMVNSIPKHRYRNVSERETEKNMHEDQDKITNLKELREKIALLDKDDKPIKSDLNLWVNEFYMGNRKWFYEACPDPKCKKSAEIGSTCSKCGTSVDYTTPHFIMGVQLSDAFGSIEVTAYDDFAHKILKQNQFSEEPELDNSNLIRGLEKMSPEERKKQVAKHLYQEFKIILFTSYENGYIKHKIGKFMQLPPADLAQINLMRIKAFL